ncbi:30S ribosomal protein S8e [Candidatus Woesearchaeota archaeon]|nr:30S ribosomal protein S8e [Candidatus Woesearchaeota archaeon]
MSIVQSRAKRKATGGRYIAFRKKKNFELGNLPSFTKLDKKKTLVLRKKGGGKKLRLLSYNIVNVFDPKTKKYSKVAIKTVLENPANRHFVRRNIMTKGTIIDTDLGKAKITNRPGQENVINAVLVS